MTELGFTPYADGLWLRDYATYAAYVRHQGAKRRTVAKDHERSYETRCDGFQSEFAQIPGMTGPVLCLGARDGCEVDAWRRLSIAAIGIDVDYPEHSPFVHYGDVHQIPYPAESFKTVYTNVLDHVLKPKDAFSEIRRVLYWNGVFVARLTPGVDEGLKPGSYECCTWSTRDQLVRFIEAQGFKQIWQKPLDSYFTLHGFWKEA